jgi:hypothetical protein
MVVCSECGDDLFRSAFSSNQLKPYGNTTCKTCTRASQRRHSCRSRSRSPDERSRSRDDRSRSRSRGRGRGRSRSRSRSRSTSGSDSDAGYWSTTEDDDSDGEDSGDENTDISDVRYTGPNLEGFLSNQGWTLLDDRGVQGVYYRNNDEAATLTIWWQTGKYRTKLDKDVHPSGQNRQMYGPKDERGRRVIEDIIKVAQSVRFHTNNRYSDH